MILPKISFKGKLVVLRPIRSDTDIQLLFLWNTDVQNLHLWTPDSDIPSYDWFAEYLKQRNRHAELVRLMVDNVSTGDTIGSVYCYDASFKDKYASFTVYIAPEQVGKKKGAEAVALFLDYLFSYFGFRKLYTDIYEYNVRSLRVARTAGMKEEGCFRLHRWFGDRFWDMYRFAVYREDFPEIKTRFMSAL